MGCGICRTQLKLDEPVPAPKGVQVVARPADLLSQENLDTLTKAGEREVVIQTRLNPELESLPSDVQKPIDSYENFGNAREDTEVVMDAPAAVKRKPDTPEGPRIASPQKPLKPLIPEVVGQPVPRAAFKTSEKPIFELPKIEKNTSEKLQGIIRLPSDLLIIETTKPELPKSPIAPVSKEETLDQLLRDIEAM